MITKQKYEFLLKVVFLALLSYFCVRFFIPHWHTLQLSARLANVSMMWLLAAIVLTAAYQACAFNVWFIILRVLGANPRAPMALRAYVYALLPKYVPGKILSHGIKAQLSVSAGVPMATVVRSIILEFLFAIGTGLTISVAGLLYYYPTAPNSISVSLTIGMVLASLFLLGFVIVRKFHILTAPSDKIGFGAYLRIIFAFLPIWLAMAVGHWCLANALSSQPMSLLFPLVVAVAASWILGVMSVFAPAGLGVREAALYFFISPWMYHEDAVLLATLSRLLLFGVEVFLTLGCWIYFRFVYSDGTERFPEIVPHDK
jgi:glycosyltransferase 2 family protein